MQGKCGGCFWNPTVGRAPSHCPHQRPTLTHNFRMNVRVNEHREDCFPISMSCLNTCNKSGLPWWLSSKESASTQERQVDAGLLPGLGRSPGSTGVGNPLQHSCQGNPWTEKPTGLYSPLGRKESDMTEHTHPCSKSPFFFFLRVSLFSK